MPATRTLATTALAAVVLAVLAACAPAATPTPESADPIVIDGLIDFGTPPATHVDTTVDYEADYGMNPPAGGNHNSIWLNCGVYDEPQANEHAVHSLEHGAVWITYDPELVSAADVQAMRASLPDTYILISPYPGLPAPVVASAWGKQVQLDGIDDPRLGMFVQLYWQSPEGPEPGAPCTGALDGPGKIG